jgi:UDP-N-acetylglucosamine acyltransferase
MSTIHPTAVIDPTCQIGENVVIGPYTCIGPDCVLEDNVTIGQHVTIKQNTHIGEGTQVHSHASLGGDPQDLGYNGDTTWLRIGKNTQIREFVTAHRASKQGDATVIGDNCLLMTAVHIGHDTTIGQHVIIASSSVVAGHVHIDDHAFISGLCAIHQHCRVGAYSMIGGVSATRQDIPPFCKAAGVPSLLMGLNSLGLRRHGVPSSSRMALKRTYKTLWLRGHNVSQAVAILDASEDIHDPYVHKLVDFMRKSTRGVVNHGTEGFRSLEDPTPDDSLDLLLEADAMRVLTD